MANISQGLPELSEYVLEDTVLNGALTLRPPTFRPLWHLDPLEKSTVTFLPSDTLTHEKNLVSKWSDCMSPLKMNILTQISGPIVTVWHLYTIHGMTLSMWTCNPLWHSIHQWQCVWKFMLDYYAVGMYIDCDFFLLCDKTPQCDFSPAQPIPSTLQ
jgi:hypothetical protein